MTEQISHKLCVAPMMQYTDMHDRYLLRLISKKVFLYTEMIATGSLIFGKCYDQLEFNSEEHQIFNCAEDRNDEQGNISNSKLKSLGFIFDEYD